MAKFYSAHVGLNRIDAANYAGWDGKLPGCENDAYYYHDICKDLGYTSSLLVLTEEATRQAVTALLTEYRRHVRPGDVFFLTYSGHGGQLPDRSGDEFDRIDETWCLYDGQLSDDSLRRLLAAFEPGVHIFVLSDSCHSGSVTRGKAPAASPSPFVPRCLPRDLADWVYVHNRSVYDAESIVQVPTGAPGATVYLWAACTDDQLAYDTGEHGLFTMHVKTALNILGFDGGFEAVRRMVESSMPDYQTPQFSVMGHALDTCSSITPFCRTVTNLL